MEHKIIIGGDLVPTNSNKEEFINGNIENIVDSKIINILKNANYRIFNLETPLTNTNNPISKEGPNLKAEVDTIKGISKINPDLVTIGNNHILDYGEEGLRDTIKLLEENAINFVGAGKNLDDAKKPFIIELENMKIGVYACTEHEYTLATETTSGANPFDPLNSLDHIETLKKEVDYVIVLYHGGKECYRYPTPYLQKVCRRIVDKGADLVVCQHSHCIGTYEEYKNSTIVYGQGNFLFDRPDKINYEVKQTGLIIEVIIDEDNNKKIEYIPIRKKNNGIELAKDVDKKEIIDNFNTRAEEIKKEGFIEENFDKTIIDEGARYLVRLSKIGSIVSALDNRIFKGKLLKRKFKNYFSLRQRHTLENMLQCEVHNEVVLQYIKLLNDQKRGEK